MPILISLLFILSAQSQNVFDLPGLIPLQYQRQAASDLVYEGKTLLPDEARQLFEIGAISDLSLLDPEDSSVIWSKEVSQTSNGPEQNVIIDLERPFHFISNTPERLGRFGFSAYQEDENGQIRIYRFSMSQTGQTTLLRKNLLRKLGYNIPPILWAPKISLNFNGNFSRNTFKSDLNSATFVNINRWITGEEEAQLDIQSLVIYPEAEDTIYQLARGDILSRIILNRRVFNSLIVPYNLVDVSDSVNAFSWNPGKIFNDQLSLPYEDALQFSTPYEDARWITRRILKLTRQDFEDIVRNAYYPKAVELLIVEKLISRRNFLREYLHFESEFSEISINSKISYLDELKDGKLQVQDWTGYAQSYSRGDPESPLSGEQLTSFFRSKLTSNIISNLITRFNEAYIPRTDLGWKIFDRQLDVSTRQFADFIRTGEVSKIPFGFYTIPFYNGNLIAAREIITGNYLGTDNLVQLADVVGFSVDAGVFIGADGIPIDLSLGFSGSARAFVTRTYAHIRPIKNIKLALKEPFRNMLVMKTKSDLSKHIDKLFSINQVDLGNEAYEDAIDEVLGGFKEKLSVGESIVITTNLGAGLNLRPYLGLNKDFSAYASWSSSQIAISRIHIFRKDENTIQVYRDPAKVNANSISMGLDGKIPILSYTFTNRNGTADTYLYNINLDPDLNDNPQLFKQIRGLSRVLKSSKTDLLAKQQSPYIIRHKFFENTSQWNLLHYRWLSLNSRDFIQVQHPEGYIKNFIRRTTGKRSGRNFEALATDVLNAAVREYSNEDISIQTNSSGDPGDSIMGRSVSQQFAFEAEIDERSGFQQIRDPYVELNYRWRNWKLSRQKLFELLFNINARFDYEFFSEEDIADIESIQLSNIGLSVSIYTEGIDYLNTFSRDQIRQIVQSYANFPSYPMTPAEILGSSQVRRLRLEREERRNRMYLNIISGMFTKFQRSYAEGDVDETIKHLSQFTTFAERLLPADIFYSLFGAEENIFVRTQIIGFREGDERASNTLMSHTKGQFGSDKGGGPLRYIQQQIGITESEFFIYWLINRL